MNADTMTVPAYMVIRDAADAPMHADMVRLFDYWRALATDGTLPGRRHFDPLAIPDLLPRLWLLDVQREPFRLRYRLCGTKLVEALGQDPTGRWLDEVHRSARDPRYIARYRQMADEGVATWRRGSGNFQHDKSWIILENLIVPLASDGRTVDVLVALTRRHDPTGA